MKPKPHRLQNDPRSLWLSFVEDAELANVSLALSFHPDDARLIEVRGEFYRMMEARRLFVHNWWGTIREA